MKIIHLLLPLLLINICSFSLHAANKISSPNCKYSFWVNIESGTPYIYISNNSKKDRLPLEKIRLGLSFLNNSDTIWHLTSISPTKIHKDDYTMLSGKRSHCVNRANECTYTFKAEHGAMIVQVRAYDNGLAFRYLDADDSIQVMDEKTVYIIPHGICRWEQPYDANGYEDFYEKRNDGTAIMNRNRSINKWGYPMLLKSADGLYALITEANVTRGLCASLLNNQKKSDEYKIERGDVSFNMAMPATSPWRVVMLGCLNDIVESTLVTDVSDSNCIISNEWIKPGASSWVYWANNHGSKDYNIVKSYIELAAKMHWPYVLIDWEWDVMKNGGSVEDAIKYANSLGVKPMLWYNSLTAWKDDNAPGASRDISNREFREKEFAWLSQIGVAGIKVDFFKGDGSQLMNYYHDLMECAARYNLLINFHGATVPRGWSRTYPNLMSAEAVYGAEYYNNDTILTSRAAWHNSVLPYTRNVVGSMDYTPGTFSDTQHPHTTSDAHELALSYLFESALQHMPDSPSAYSGLSHQVCTLLSQLPTAWDDTKFLSGEPGESVVLARRRGDTWYIAGINGKDEPQSISVDIASLNIKKGKCIIYKDKDSQKGFNIEKIDKLPKIYTVQCLGRGGFVIKIDYR